MESNAVHSPFRVAAYCRVSPNKAKLPGAITAKREDFSKKVDGHPNFILAEVFIDETMPGLPMKHRKSFKRMLRQCRRGKIDIVMTEPYLNIGATLWDAVNSLRELRRLNIPVLVGNEEIGSSETSVDRLIAIYDTIMRTQAESITHNSAHKMFFQKATIRKEILR